MELSKTEIEATRLYTQRLAPHRSPEDLISKKFIQASETIIKANIPESKLNLVSALVEHLISPEGDFFLLTQDTDNLIGFKQMVTELRKKWEFRYDEILNVLEYKHFDKWQPCNENNLKTYLQNNNIKFKDTALSAWLGSDEIQPYNALKDYFNDLPEWDGKTDWAGLLCNYIDIDEPAKNTERKDFFKSMFKKHLIRMLRQSFDGVENRYVLVFQSSKQEIGKSHFFRWLCPLPAKYRHEMSGNVKIDKDAKLPLTTSFYCLIDEIEMDKRNISDIKNVISIDSFNIRRPYAKNHETIPRMASFFGTCNNKNYLFDDSNARFLSFSVNHINHDYDNRDNDLRPEIPKHLLWAQIYALYKAEEKGTLTREEKDLQANINLEFGSDSLVVQFALKNYRMIDPDEIKSNSYVVSAYDFFVDFDNLHRGMTLAQVSKELRSLPDSDEFSLTSKRMSKNGKKDTYFNLVSKY